MLESGNFIRRDDVTVFSGSLSIPERPQLIFPPDQRLAGKLPIFQIIFFLKILFSFNGMEIFFITVE